MSFIELYCTNQGFSGSPQSYVTFFIAWAHFGIFLTKYLSFKIIHVVNQRCVNQRVCPQIGRRFSSGILQDSPPDFQDFALQISRIFLYLNKRENELY